MSSFFLFGLDVAIKNCCVLLLATILTACLRRSAAASRHLIWSWAVMLVLLMPLLVIALPGLPVLAGPAWMRIVPAETGAEQSEPIASMELATPASVPDSATIAPPSPSFLTSPSHGPLPIDQHAPFAAPTPTAPSDWPAQGMPPAGDAAPRGLPSPPPAEAVRTLPPAPTPAPRFDLPTLLVATWLGGAVLALLPLALGLLSLGLLQRSATVLRHGRLHAMLEALRADIGLRRPVVLLMSRDRCVPMTWGLSAGLLPGARARLLLPEAAEHWSSDRVRAVLLHELAHIQRRDCLTQALTQLACALHWFNPLIWYAAHRLLFEREQACDDRVLQQAVPPSDYAEHLLAIATHSVRRPFSLHAGIAMARTSPIETRLQAILDRHRRREALSRDRAGLLLALLGAVALPVAMLQAEAKQASDNSEATSSAMAASAYLSHWVFELPGETVDAVIPAKRRKPSGQRDASLPFSAWDPASTNHATFVATLSQDDLQQLQETVDAHALRLSKQHRPLSSSNTSWIADTWAYSRAEPDLLGGGTGTGLFSTIQREGQPWLRLDYRLTHTINRATPVHSHVYIEAPYPRDQYLATLTPFKREDNSRRVLLILTRVTPTPTASAWPLDPDRTTLEAAGETTSPGAADAVIPDMITRRHQMQVVLMALTDHLLANDQQIPARLEDVRPHLSEPVPLDRFHYVPPPPSYYQPRWIPADTPHPQLPGSIAIFPMPLQPLAQMPVLSDLASDPLDITQALLVERAGAFPAGEPFLWSNRYGIITLSPAESHTTEIRQIPAAPDFPTRRDQIQRVMDALNQYRAEHDGAWPENLEDARAFLAEPVPLERFTYKPNDILFVLPEANAAPQLQLPKGTTFYLPEGQLQVPPAESRTPADMPRHDVPPAPLSEMPIHRPQEEAITRMPTHQVPSEGSHQKPRIPSDRSPHTIVPPYAGSITAHQFHLLREKDLLPNAVPLAGMRDGTVMLLPRHPDITRVMQQEFAMALVASLHRGNFDLARRDFSPEMRAALSAEALRDLWQQLDRIGGAYQSSGQPRHRREQGHDVFDVRLRWERNAVDLKIVFDPAARIAGLWTMPPHPDPATAPREAATRWLPPTEAELAARLSDTARQVRDHLRAGHVSAAWRLLDEPVQTLFPTDLLAFFWQALGDDLLDLLLAPADPAARPDLNERVQIAQSNAWAQAVGDQLLALLATSRFEAIRPLLHPLWQRALTTDQIAADWQNLLEALGPYQGHGEAKITENHGYTALAIPIHFERQSFGLSLVLDRQHRILGPYPFAFAQAETLLATPDARAEEKASASPSPLPTFAEREARMQQVLAALLAYRQHHEGRLPERLDALLPHLAAADSALLQHVRYLHPPRPLSVTLPIPIGLTHPLIVAPDVALVEMVPVAPDQGAIYGLPSGQLLTRPPQAASESPSSTDSPAPPTTRPWVPLSLHRVPNEDTLLSLARILEDAAPEGRTAQEHIAALRAELARLGPNPERPFSERLTDWREPAFRWLPLAGGDDLPEWTAILGEHAGRRYLLVANREPMILRHTQPGASGRAHSWGIRSATQRAMPDGRVQVRIDLEAADARILDTFSRQHQGQSIAVQWEGEIITVPVVRDAIQGLALSFPTPAQAEALVTAMHFYAGLQPPSLTGSLSPLPASTLSFHLLVTRETLPARLGRFAPPEGEAVDWEAMITLNQQAFETHGPDAFAPNNPFRWVRWPEGQALPADLLQATYAGATFVMVFNQPPWMLSQATLTEAAAAANAPRPFLIRAQLQLDELDRPVFLLQLSDDASAAMRELSAAHIGQQLAVVLDDQILMAPALRDRLEGAMTISGSFTWPEVRGHLQRLGRLIPAVE